MKYAKNMKIRFLNKYNPFLQDYSYLNINKFNPKDKKI